MQELLRTNDPILISFVQSMLNDEAIDPVVFDSHIANLEGGVSAFQCRLMVID